VLLAGDAYWMVHNDWTGRLRTSARAAGLVVGTAVLGQLIADGVISTYRGDVYLAEGHPVPAEALAREVYAQIVGEPKHYPVGDWLEFLAPEICDRVGWRMVEAGTAWTETIGVVRRRRLFRPTDAQRAAWVYAALVTGIRNGQRFEQSQLFMLRLAVAGSLRHQLLVDAGPDHVDGALQQLGLLWPPWLELLQAADLAIAATALTRQQ
jgi:hypothetical protein